MALDQSLPLLQTLGLNMKLPDDLRPGDILLYGGSGGGEGFAAENDPDTDHAARYIGDGKVFTAFPKGGVGVYDFNPAGLVHVRRPLGQFNLAKVLAWIPTVAGAPYGWGDIKSAAGLNETPHYFVPDAATIHATGADCSDCTAMAGEVGECPDFDPAFDKRRITPAHFKLSIASRAMLDIAPSAAPVKPDLPPRAQGEQITHTS